MRLRHQRVRDRHVLRSATAMSTCASARGRALAMEDHVYPDGCRGSEIGLSIGWQRPGTVPARGTGHGAQGMERDRGDHSRRSSATSSSVGVHEGNLVKIAVSYKCAKSLEADKVFPRESFDSQCPTKSVRIEREAGARIDAGDVGNRWGIEGEG